MNFIEVACPEKLVITFWSDDDESGAEWRATLNGKDYAHGILGVPKSFASIRWLVDDADQFIQKEAMRTERELELEKKIEELKTKLMVVHKEMEKRMLWGRKM